jgi:hypothetical protein
LVVALAALSAAPAARAQGKPADEARLAEASKLFGEANAELDAKRFAEACPKLERVVALVPEGVGAKLALGECYEGLGRLASADGVYAAAEVAAAEAKQPHRVNQARAKREAIAPRLAFLELRARGSVRGLTVTIDRQKVEKWPAAVAVDAGRHVVRATAPDAIPFERRIDVTDGQRVEITIPEPTPLSSAGPPAEPEPTGWGPQKIAGTVLGGAGLLSAIGGFIAGGVALSKRDASNGPEGGCSDETNLCAKREGVELRESSRLAGDVSTALLVTGGVFAATGLVVFLTAPDEAPQASVGVSATGLSFRLEL